MEKYNIIYVLTNPAMSGLVKIGQALQSDANNHIAQLYTEGVPVPFTLEFAAHVQNAEEVEKALHIAFAPNRINPRRGFFSIDPEQAIAILKLLHTDDVTTDVSEQSTNLDQQSIIAANTLRSKRPRLNFKVMGIPVGAILQSVHDDTTVEVISDRKVRMGKEETFLTAATRQVLGLDYDVAPSPHWTYQGQLLKEIYDETYGIR